MVLKPGNRVVVGLEVFRGAQKVGALQRTGCGQAVHM